MDSVVINGISEEEKAELEAKHEDIGTLHSGVRGRWEVVFRRPTRGEYEQFKQRAMTNGTKHKAQEILGRQTCVGVYYKGKVTTDPKEVAKAFDVLLDRYVGICDSEPASNLFSRLMGDAVDDHVKS